MHKVFKRLIKNDFYEVSTMKKWISMFMTVAVLLCLTASASWASAASVNTALLSYLAGDVNGDWTVTSSDVRAVYASVSGESGNTVLPKAADANADGAVNALDVLQSLQTTVGTLESVLFKSDITVKEAAPVGKTVDFTLANTQFQYANDSRRQEDVWIAQSLEELQAGYAHSNSRTDYTAAYTDEFFEDHAVIVWASHCFEYGLVNVQMDRIVKNGNELCLVRHITMDLDMPFDWFDRYILEISKAELEGVDTVCTATEYTYSDAFE